MSRLEETETGPGPSLESSRCSRKSFRSSMTSVTSIFSRKSSKSSTDTREASPPPSVEECKSLSASATTGSVQTSLLNCDSLDSNVASQRNVASDRGADSLVSEGRLDQDTISCHELNVTNMVPNLNTPSLEAAKPHSLPAEQKSLPERSKKLKRQKCIENELHFTQLMPISDTHHPSNVPLLVKRRYEKPIILTKLRDIFCASKNPYVEDPSEAHDDYFVFTPKLKNLNKRLCKQRPPMSRSYSAPVELQTRPVRPDNQKGGLQWDGDKLVYIPRYASKSHAESTGGRSYATRTRRSGISTAPQGKRIKSRRRHTSSGIPSGTKTSTQFSQVDGAATRWNLGIISSTASPSGTTHEDDVRSQYAWPTVTNATLSDHHYSAPLRNASSRRLNPKIHTPYTSTIPPVPPIPSSFAHNATIELPPSLDIGVEPTLRDHSLSQSAHKSSQHRPFVSSPLCVSSSSSTEQEDLPRSSSDRQIASEPTSLYSDTSSPIATRTQTRPLHDIPLMKQVIVEEQTTEDIESARIAVCEAEQDWLMQREQQAILEAVRKEQVQKAIKEAKSHDTRFQKGLRKLSFGMIATDMEKAMKELRMQEVLEAGPSLVKTRSKSTRSCRWGREGRNDQTKTREGMEKEQAQNRGARK